MKSILGQAAFLCFLLAGCIGGNTDEADNDDGGSTNPGQTVAQLAGDGTVCVDVTGGTLGSGLNGTSYIQYLDLNDNGTFSFSLLFFSGACASTVNANGDNYMTYSQAGTFATSGASTTVTNGTNATFTVLGSNLTVRAGYAMGATIRTFLNGQCIPAFTFTAAATSTENPNGNNCVATGTITLPNFPANNSVYYNVYYNPVNTTLSAGERIDLWNVGAGGFPTSFTQTFYTW